MSALIAVRGLRKAYQGHEAVRGLDLEVRAGQIVAILGPNGAGKTTTVEILEGLRNRDAGEVEVLGEDPQHAGGAWRARMGVVLQASQVPQLLTVKEALTKFAGYYPHPRPVADTIALVGLEAQADKRAGRLSGGQQRRLEVGLALIGDPELVFLDEPTTGFDPQARRDAWEVIDGLKALGKTVLLTTHYMEEAARLADRVVIIKDGVVVADAPPDELSAEHDATIAFTAPADTPWGDGRVVIRSTALVADLANVTAWALEHGYDLPDLEVNRPSLEDVYLELTR
jgi:ABC-2 type transport system ATP-binding protein